MRHYSRGFTLIELLVVVAIIGILSAVGVTSYSGYKSSAEKKQAEITLNSIYLAEQEYKSNNGEYLITNSQDKIVADLFDGIDDLDGQAYTFKTTSADTLTIIATTASPARISSKKLTIPMISSTIGCGAFPGAIVVTIILARRSTGIPSNPLKKFFLCFSISDSFPNIL